jgi:hypothetical protein
MGMQVRRASRLVLVVAVVVLPTGCGCRVEVLEQLRSPDGAITFT